MKKPNLVRQPSSKETTNSQVSPLSCKDHSTLTVHYALILSLSLRLFLLPGSSHYCWWSLSLCTGRCSRLGDRKSRVIYDQFCPAPLILWLVWRLISFFLSRPATIGLDYILNRSIDPSARVGSACCRQERDFLSSSLGSTWHIIEFGISLLGNIHLLLLLSIQMPELGVLNRWYLDTLLYLLRLFLNV